MKKLQSIIISVISVFTLMLVPVLATGSTVYAQTPKAEICKGVNNGGGCTSGNEFNTFIKNIINILLFIIGAVAVIMIIIGGLRYILSGGDSSSTKSARDTVLYAVVGLVIAISAYAIVNFVVVKL